MTRREWRIVWALYFANAIPCAYLIASRFGS